MREVAGIYLRLGDEIDRGVNRRVHALAAAIAKNRLPGITDVDPCYACVYVEFDTRSLNAAKVGAWARGLPLEASDDAGRGARPGLRAAGAAATGAHRRGA